MTKNEQRIAYWRGLVEEQTQSGLSASVFCHDHHLKLPQFYRWRRRFRNRQRNPSSTGFLALIPTHERSGSGIRIHNGNAMAIEVERDFDPLTLRAVIDALGWE